MIDLTLILLAGEEVDAVAAVTREAQSKVAGDLIVSSRHISIAAGVAVIPRMQLRLARRVGARVACDDLDDAPGSIAAEQRPLWPVQDLDPFDAAHVQQGADRRGEVNA